MISRKCVVRVILPIESKCHYACVGEAGNLPVPAELIEAMAMPLCKKWCKTADAPAILIFCKAPGYRLEGTVMMSEAEFLDLAWKSCTKRVLAMIGEYSKDWVPTGP